MVFYHKSPRCREADEQVAAEIRTIAGFVKELGLGTDGIDERIIRPVDFELTTRYGPELGPRLLGVFVEAFEGPLIPSAAEGSRK